jgi:protein TonB
MHSNSLPISIPLQFPLPKPGDPGDSRRLVCDQSLTRKEAELFDYSFIPDTPGRRPLMAVIASLIEVVLVAAIIIIPLFFEATLHVRGLMNALILAPIPTAPLAPAAPVVAKRPRTAPTSRTFDPKVLVSPTVVPTEVAVINDAPAAPEIVPGGVVGGIPGLPVAPAATPLMNVPAFVPPPPLKIVVAPPPPPPPPAVPERITVGGNVQAALLLKQEEPPYPPLARKGRIQGRVRMQAIIGTDGRIKDLTVLSGPPLLVEAAVNAVRHWVYRPTVLNHNPVEVNTEIIMRFELTR